MQEICDRVRVLILLLTDDANQVLHNVAPPFVDHHSDCQISQKMLACQLNGSDVPEEMERTDSKANPSMITGNADNVCINNNLISV